MVTLHSAVSFGRSSRTSKDQSQLFSKASVGAFSSIVVGALLELRIPVRELISSLNDSFIVIIGLIVGYFKIFCSIQEISEVNFLI